MIILTHNLKEITQTDINIIKCEIDRMDGMLIAAIDDTNKTYILDNKYNVLYDKDYEKIFSSNNIKKVYQIFKSLGINLDGSFIFFGGVPEMNREIEEILTRFRLYDYMREIGYTSIIIDGYNYLVIDYEVD